MFTTNNPKHHIYSGYGAHGSYKVNKKNRKNRKAEDKKMLKEWKLEKDAQ